MPVLAFICAAAVPVALWHHAIGAVAEDFRFELGYLTGWSGFGLIALGLLLMLPLVVSARPRLRNALFRSRSKRGFGRKRRKILLPGSAFLNLNQVKNSFRRNLRTVRPWTRN